VHDLRTPLTIVSGNVQLMERADDRERRHALGGTVLAQVDHINQMMRELLAYARGELRLYLRSVSLAALVDELRDQLSLEFADSGVALVVEATSGENVRIDDGKVRRVLFNLARNAREAMPDGGQYHIVFSLVGDALVIRCMDDGPGIPDAVRHRVFDAFVSSRTGRDNSGLGLAIVKRLVEEHGGTVSFASNAGRGTVFELTIPNAREGTADG
jgi:signal transduction histidine kinase